MVIIGVKMFKLLLLIVENDFNRAVTFSGTLSRSGNVRNIGILSAEVIRSFTSQFCKQIFICKIIKIARGC